MMTCKYFKLFKALSFTEYRCSIFIILFSSLIGKTQPSLPSIPRIPSIPSVPGSMMMVIPSITTLQGQLEVEATGMGLTVLNLNKVPKYGGFRVETVLNPDP